MTSASDLISRTRNDYLSPSQSERRNKLAADISASDELLSFARPTNFGDGSKLSIGLEDIHVWSVDAVAKTADVDRGEYGTVAATATADAVVLVDPRYTNSQILRALNVAVSMLVSEGIVGVSTIEHTYSSSVAGYDVTGSTRFLDLLSVHWESSDATAKEWYRLPNVRVLRDANVADFASGTGIFVGQTLPNDVTLRISYTHELTGTLSALTDDVETITGLDPVAIDLLCIGAALTLTAGKEVALNETDAARPRRSSEVPAGAFSQADSNLRALWRDRVKSERGRQKRKYGRTRAREF